MKGSLFKILKVLVLGLVYPMTTYASAINHVRVNDELIEFDPRVTTTVEIIEEIEELGKQQQILKVDFRENDIQDKHIKRLMPFLQKLPDVEYISFRNNKITGDIFSSENPNNITDDLFKLILKPTLKYIDLSNNFIDSDTFMAVLDRRKLLRALVGAIAGGAVGLAAHNALSPNSGRDRGAIMAAVGALLGGLAVYRLDDIDKLFTKIIWFPDPELAKGQSADIEKAHEVYYMEYFKEY